MYLRISTQNDQCEAIFRKEWKGREEELFGNPEREHVNYKEKKIRPTCFSPTPCIFKIFTESMNQGFNIQ